MKRGVKRSILSVIMVAMVIISLFSVERQVDAAGKVSTISKSIKPIGGQKGNKLWVQDTITFKVQDGKIVSKPTVKSTTSTVNQIIGGAKIHPNVSVGQYYQLKPPTISYKKGSKTATVTTYWGVKQGVSAGFLKVTWGKTCTVTYTINGNGKITYTKKASGIKFFL